jgi:hypothetical protein
VLDDVHDLKSLREELRLQAHLFKAEAKDKFEAVEKRWREAQRIIQSLEGKSSGAAKDVTTATRTTVAELAEQYRRLKADLAPR